MNKYHIQIGQLFVCIAKYMHMHFRCLFYNMKILYTKSKVSEHSSWSRAARQPAKSRMRLATSNVWIKLKKELTSSDLHIYLCAINMTPLSYYNQNL